MIDRKIWKGDALVLEMPCNAFYGRHEVVRLETGSRLCTARRDAEEGDPLVEIDGYIVHRDSLRELDDDEGRLWRYAGAIGASKEDVRAALGVLGYPVAPPRPVSSIIDGPGVRCFDYPAARLWFLECGGKTFAVLAVNSDEAAGIVEDAQIEKAPRDGGA